MDTKVVNQLVLKKWRKSNFAKSGDNWRTIFIVFNESSSFSPREGARLINSVNILRIQETRSLFVKYLSGRGEKKEYQNS